MSKIAFVFPGQGSQALGMGKEWFEQFPIELSSLKSAVLSVFGDALFNVMWGESEPDLGVTTNTQPALFVTSAAIFTLLQSKGYTPDFVAGHSLGEYSALFAAGAFDFTAGLHLVKHRSQLMEKAMPAGTGTMAAIMGLAPEQIKALCESTSGIVEVANYNNDNQTIISGEKSAVLAAMVAIKAAGAKRAIELNVSGPFHSSLMKPAAEAFRQVLDDTVIADATIPVIANCTAKPEISPKEIRDNLVSQLSHSVYWLQSIQYMVAQGVTCFVECGSGKVLSGIIKRIAPEATILSCEKVSDLSAVDALMVKS